MDGNNNSTCMKWPWECNGDNKIEGCKVGAPWLFKSLANVGKVLTCLGSSGDLSTWNKLNLKAVPSLSVSPGEQGEAEQRALALALTTKKEVTLLEFYSPKCRLCASLENIVAKVEAKNGAWLNVVMADVENKCYCRIYTK